MSRQGPIKKEGAGRRWNGRLGRPNSFDMPIGGIGHTANDRSQTSRFGVIGTPGINRFVIESRFPAQVRRRCAAWCGTARR